MQYNRYFIYVRKSTDEKTKQVASIQDQISETQKLAKTLNLNVVDIISESKSAKKPGRKEFNAMLKRIENGEADGVICWKLNRLARNSVDAGNIISLLQQKQIKHIQTFGRSYYPSDNVLMMYIEFGMANQFVNDLKVDVKRGLYRKAQRGWFPASTLPTGYSHNKNRKENPNEPEILKDEKTFSLIQQLWKCLLSGDYSISDLKRLGDSLDLKTKKGNKIATSSYYRLFNNAFYAGYYTWNDLDGVTHRIKGKHIPMITKKEYELSQKILQKKSKTNPTGKYTHDYIALFSCGECGCSITADVKKRAY